MNKSAFSVHRNHISCTYKFSTLFKTVFLLALNLTLQLHRIPVMIGMRKQIGEYRMAKKYEMIYRDLVRKITHQLYQSGTFLPSENELTELYGASRETVRKALGSLLENGFIHKIKGKGSLVLGLDKYAFPISGLTSYRELDSLFDMHTDTQVLQLTQTTVPQTLFHLESEEQLPATYIQRLRVVNGQPLVIDNDYVLTSIVPHISKGVAQDSLYRYFEETLKLEIGYGSKEFTVIPATEEQCQILNLPPNSSVVSVKGVTHLQDNTLLQFTESIHRADKFKFIEHARRKII